MLAATSRLLRSRPVSIASRFRRQGSKRPVNIVTSTSTISGIPNTVRPDLIGPVQTVGRIDQWFDTSAFVAVNRIGNLTRNAVIGPSFNNTDLSITKTTTLKGGIRLE